MLRLSALMTIWAMPALAHDFDELTITSVSRSSGSYIEINLQDTVAGREIVCALYDDGGTLIASDSQITDNLATRVLIRYEGSDVASARCAFND